MPHFFPTDLFHWCAVNTQRYIIRNKNWFQAYWRMVSRRQAWTLLGKQIIINGFTEKKRFILRLAVCTAGY
jgi:hypothetical protein